MHPRVRCQTIYRALYQLFLFPISFFLWSPNKILPHGILRFSNGSHLNSSNCLHSRFDYVILPVKPSAFWYIAVIFHLNFCTAGFIFMDIADVFLRFDYLQMVVSLFFVVLFFPWGGEDAEKRGKRCLGFSLWLLPISYSLSFVWPSFNNNFFFKSLLQSFRQFCT